MAELASTCRPDVIPISNLASRPRRPRPSASAALAIAIDSLLLTCFLALVLALCNKPGSTMDEDLWWHLRSGDAIIQHHSVPTHDDFSSYTRGQPLIAYSWLFEILVSKLYGHWRLPGILALTGTLLLASVSALIFLLSRYTTLRRSLAITAPALFGLITLASPRPWLFTILFFTVELYLLLKTRESGRIACLWPIVPLFALWANMHIQFIYGLILIGLFAIESPLARLLRLGPACTRLPARWFWALLVTATAATLVNPYGLRLYSSAAQYATQSVYLSILQEMQPLQFRSITDWAPMLLVCAAFFAVAGLKRRHPVLILVLAMSCWFGFRTGRDIWLLVITSAVILAHSLKPRLGDSPRFRWVPWAVALPLNLALGYSLLHANKNSERALEQARDKRFPERAAAYIETHGLQNPLYNTLTWGGYLIWRLPTMPVSIDGRTNVHGDAHVSRSINTWLGKGDWADDPELRGARTILLDRDCPLASILRSDARFHLVYQDDIASVFQPVRLLEDAPKH